MKSAIPDFSVMKSPPENDPPARIIDKTAYQQLHNFPSTYKRFSVSSLKEKYEQTPQSSISEEVIPASKFSPRDFGYPANANLRAPLIRDKDQNANDVCAVEREINILTRSESEESVDRIEKELDFFTMDTRPKPQPRKRSNSFRKMFSGVFSGKDKKKGSKSEDERRASETSLVYTDNYVNESSFHRQINAVPPQQHQKPDPNKASSDDQKIKQLEKDYAEMHINKFNEIKKNFADTPSANKGYVPMNKPPIRPKPSISDYISAPVNKYIDTSSSSASGDSEIRHNMYHRETPPRAQETSQNLRVISPKSISNPHYQNEKASPRTIERNLNSSNNSKPKFDFDTKLEETYGTVFDSLEYTQRPSTNSNRNSSAMSPRSPTLEGSKLRLPSNREKLQVQPRVRSPIPANRVSTDKIIATELLKSSRSPVPMRRVIPAPTYENDSVVDSVRGRKPPASPKTSARSSQEKIITNVQVHAPGQLPPLSPQYPGSRSSTPVNLRMSAALKLSPQKDDIRKSVEEYYWKELKKIKDQEDYKLYCMQLSNGYFEEPATKFRRSRSLSPSQRVGRRSLSLPREPRVDNPYGGRLPHQSIPEHSPLEVDLSARRQLQFNQNFTRNNPERRSLDGYGGQRPIFRRGSLSQPDGGYDTYQNTYGKRVSFSSSHRPDQAWPTKNGYTQSPPQRRLEKRDSFLDDDVFYPAEPIYAPQPNIYSPQRSEFYDNQIYAPRPVLGGSRMSMVDTQDVYVTRAQYPYQNFQPQNEPIYGGAIYSSRGSIPDAYQNNKQVTVRNRYCDLYGKIHDAPPQTGVIMGHLQQRPLPPPRVYPQQPFVRGTRLTASAHDIGAPRRYYNNGERGYVMAPQKPPVSNSYDHRPLPPLPTKKVEMSDSGSEVYNKAQVKPKKKRGLFGGK